MHLKSLNVSRPNVIGFFNRNVFFEQTWTGLSLAGIALFSVSLFKAEPAGAEPLVVKDSHGNVATVEQSGIPKMHSGTHLMDSPQPVNPSDGNSRPRESGSKAGAHANDAIGTTGDQDDLDILTDEDEGHVFEDDQGNIAVIEQDDEPATLVNPAE